jgi:hypothetical protein
MLSLERLQHPEEHLCSGLVFRGRRSQYTSHRTELHTHTKLSLLKRKSCKGCDQCSWLLDELSETASSDNIIYPNILDGATYTLTVVNISRDWETGLVDDWNLEFKEINDD